ncbi:carotenoid oxygenase family protein [Paraburkholderia graminis]|uniref:carotenoid oxygenase family protein n=1 Tax=Paraburkholderia graminis TaxID=60548 RepID=UPI0038B6FC8A
MAAYTFDPAMVFDAEDEAIEKAMEIDAHNEKSPYNYYGYEPVTDELRHVPLRVTGKIPEDLVGVYLRNGTNTQFEKTHQYLHCFNGAGMLHQVQILNGEATYSNTYIRTPVYEAERHAGRELYPCFSDIASGGQLALKKIERIERKKREGMIPNFSYLENVQASTAVQVHEGRILCLAEVGLPFALNSRVEKNGLLTLDGTGRFETWGGKLKTAFSAHCRIDPRNGDFYSVTMDRMTSRVSVTHLSKDDVVNAASVYQQDDSTGRMANLHDCFLTENFIIFSDVSLRQSREWISGPSGSVFRFDHNRKLRFGVIPRNFDEHTKVRWFETHRAGLIWHNINAWEQTRADGGTEIVLFAPMFHEYPDNVPIHTPDEPPSKLNKWVLDLETGQCTVDKTLIEHGYERPSFNLHYVARENRYAYLIDEEKGGYMGQGVLKYDLLAEREIAYFDYGDFYGGEALFVPRENSASEDDGYLVELMMGRDTADFVIIDAKEMVELARVHLPRRVPFGVHACWIDTMKLERLRT